jgi:UDP-N-acetylmuramoyl-tripeptide--D-alanyl-D-alanine ligase
VALTGERFDGHDYLDVAASAGVRAAVVSRAVECGGDLIQYRVPDTLVALGDLAGFRRDALPARVVGITGSSGKTGTKEYTQAAVGSELRVHATAANLNNRIGVPLTLLAAPVGAEVLVVEMGTNEPGEIHKLTRIAKPEVAIVTTVSESHLAGLGDLAGVMREKLAIFEQLPSNGVAVVGESPSTLADSARALGVDVQVAGMGPGADPHLRATDLSQDEQGRWSFTWRGARARLARPGRHEVGNAALALAAAEVLGVDPQGALDAITQVQPGSMRGEILRLGELRLIVDCYNANPQSTAAAMTTVRDWPSAARRVAILGSMLELGPRSEALHRELLTEAVSGGIDLVIATGLYAEVGGTEIAGGVRLEIVPEVADVAAILETQIDAGDVVLLKGSRGVRLEQLIPAMRDQFGAGEVD